LTSAIASRASSSQGNISSISSNPPSMSCTALSNA